MKKKYKDSSYKNKIILSFICLIISLYILSLNFYASKFALALSYRISRVIFSTVDLFKNIPNKYTLYINNISYAKKLEQEVSALKSELSTLEALSITYKTTKEENYELKNLLYTLNKSTLINIKNIVTTSVYSKNLGVSSPILLINVGTNNGIVDNLTVIANNSLVGITQDTTKDYSKIILLTNSKSRIPVYTKNSQINAIMVGSNTSAPYLISYDKNQSFNDGDLLLTSGLGKLFQRNIPVGTIYNDKGVWAVKLFNNFYNIDYVHIIRKNKNLK